MRDQGPTEGRFKSVRDLGDEFERVAFHAPAPRSLLRRRWVTVTASLAIAATVVSITPPGGALADAIGDLVGVGDDPSDPILVNGDDGVVVGVGESPNGQPVELVATTPLVQRGGQESTTPCVYPSFPAAEVHAVGISCQEVGDGELAVFPYRGPSELGSDSSLLVTAKASAAASGIEVVYVEDGSEIVAPQVSGFVDETLVASIGAEEEFRYAVAFLPADIGEFEAADPREAIEAAAQAASAITVRTLGPEGEVLSSLNLGEDLPRRLPRILAQTEVAGGTPPVLRAIGQR